jgi:tRNA(fMet)-specific endonuclease VapC
LLDTNTCIAGIKGDAAVSAKLRAQAPSALAVSAVTLAELWFGARKAKQPSRMRALQDAFLAPFAVLDFSAAAAEAYAEIRLDLERRGLPIGERDQLIAATARAADRTVVTGNTREFRRVAKLRVVDWSR